MEKQPVKIRELLELAELLETAYVVVSAANEGQQPSSYKYNLHNILALAAQAVALKIKQTTGNGADDLMSQKAVTEALDVLSGMITAEETRAQAAEGSLDGRIGAVESLVPAAAASGNELADKAFVNSTVATNSATFRGTFNSVADLQAYSGEKDNNDYAFVRGTDEAGNSTYSRYKYTGSNWAFEYTLNNSSFTALQWAAINSGITASLVAEFAAKYVKPSNGIPAGDLSEVVRNALNLASSALQAAALVPYRTALEQDVIDNGKVDKVQGKGLSDENFSASEKTKLATLENYDDSEVKGEIEALEDAVQDLEGLIPSAASQDNQLADKGFVNSSVATNTANYISDNGQPFSSIAALLAYSGPLTNNDYAFVTGSDSAGNTTYTRYKYNASTEQWGAEYVLNNSSFTAAQWAAINSGVTGTKLAQMLSDIGTKYVKPSLGIPASDMSSEVQTMLGKAGTALQSESDPTVPTWAKQPVKPTYNYSEIQNTPTIPEFTDYTDAELQTAIDTAFANL